MKTKTHILLKNLDFANLREKNVARCEQVFHKIHDWSTTDWATAVAGECGEMCNLIKKLRRLDGGDKHLDTDIKREEITLAIGKEMADIVIYLDLLAKKFEIDLAREIIEKFNDVSLERQSNIFLP